MLIYNFSELTGKVITKDDFEYEESRKSWNRAIEKYPLAIVYCENRDDIKNAILWARNNDIAFRVRSGCHNYEGFSTGNDVLVIDISRINSIIIDEANKYVKLDNFDDVINKVKNNEVDFEETKIDRACLKDTYTYFWEWCSDAKFRIEVLRNTIEETLGLKDDFMTMLNALMEAEEQE